MSIKSKYILLMLVLLVIYLTQIGCEKSAYNEQRMLENRDAYIAGTSFTNMTNFKSYKCVVKQTRIMLLNNKMFAIIFIFNGTNYSFVENDATESQIEFVKQLEIGKSYVFPDVYINWIKSNTVNGSSLELKGQRPVSVLTIDTNSTNASN